IDRDAEVTLINETQGKYGDDFMFDTGVLTGEEVFAGHGVAKKEISTADPVTTAGEVVITAGVISVAIIIQVSAALVITEVELTLPQTLAGLKKSAKPKVVVQESVQGTTVITLPTAPTTVVASTRPKAKGIIIQESKETTTRTTTTTTTVPS
ncbi:hypothetical protein Tco_1372213, partial [Tanacetum coccineum]